MAKELIKSAAIRNRIKIKFNPITAKRYFGTLMPEKIIGKTWIPFPKEKIGKDPIRKYRATWGPVLKATWEGNDLWIEV